MGDSMSPADVAAVVGNTDRNNFGYAYPVLPYGGGFGGNSGFGNGFGSDILWIIVLLALMGGFGNNGNGGFGNGFNDDYAWLSNGQKEIMQNTNQGFNTLHLSNQVEGVRDGINSLSNQLCNCCADMTQTVSNGFYNAEIGANNRQMANMQQAFNLSTQLADCCCENRLATERLNATILSENCADRQALSEGVRDIITNATQNSQAILDKLCQLELDGIKAQVEAKNDRIADLQRELQMADLKASQTAQTAELRLGQEREIDAMYQRLRDCPVGTVPVFGNQPIFTCSSNVGGCGCGNTYGNTIV